MHKRTSKIEDVNALAASIVGQTTGGTILPRRHATIATERAGKFAPEKNPAAVALGRLGGLKGGYARASKLSPARRKEIASKAAKSRWAKREI